MSSHYYIIISLHYCITIVWLLSYYYYCCYFYYWSLLLLSILSLLLLLLLLSLLLLFVSWLFQKNPMGLLKPTSSARLLRFRWHRWHLKDLRLEPPGFMFAESRPETPADLGQTLWRKMGKATKRGWNCQLRFWWWIKVTKKWSTMRCWEWIRSACKANAFRKRCWIQFLRVKMGEMVDSLSGLDSTSEIDDVYLVGGLRHYQFVFLYIGHNNPNRLIFFRGVETTNQVFTCHILL